MLTFHYEPDATAAANHLSERLTRELQSGQNVVWLVPGGSNIALSVYIMQLLPKDCIQNLTCILTDERYGKPGHPDSNWQQLAEAGFMERGVEFPATLIPDLTLEDTSQQYGKVVDAVFAQAGVIIGQFGIGGDGHIAGILPRSAAVSSDQPVVGYDSGTFIRITLTPSRLKDITAAYAFVYGDNKYQALERLQKNSLQELSLEEQPSQILKQLPESYIYTDQTF